MPVDLLYPIDYFETSASASRDVDARGDGGGGGGGGGSRRRGVRCESREGSQLISVSPFDFLQGFKAPLDLVVDEIVVVVFLRLTVTEGRALELLFM